MARRRNLELLGSFLRKVYGLFGITVENQMIKDFPFIFFETLLLWIVLGHYFGGKRKQISNTELLILCTGLVMDNTFSGIGFATEGTIDEDNIMYAGSCIFFQNLFNISAVAATRCLTLIEVSILYFYIKTFGLNTPTRIMLHILNLLRFKLGYEWSVKPIREPLERVYNLIDYISFRKSDSKFLGLFI